MRQKVTIDEYDEIWNQFSKTTIRDDTRRCSFCSEIDSVRLEDGNYTCQKCNTVNSRFIDASAEWHFSNGQRQDSTRCGMPVNDLIPQASFGSIIAYSSHESADIKSIRKYMMWNSLSYKDRSLIKIFDTLTTAALTNGIPKSIIENSKNMYKSISELGVVTRGANRSGIIASCIYMSCKQENVPRSAKEIAKVFNLPLSTMTRGCKRIQEMLKLDFEPSTALDFIGRFCSNLGMDRAKTHECELLLERVLDANELTHNAPPSLAAACIDVCSRANAWNISKKSICAACDVSIVTVTKCAAELARFGGVTPKAPDCGAAAPQAPCNASK